jgi:photosystem II stability/assembly factor-like uncharacterized protein
MIACMSTNGPIDFHGDARPDRLLVATADGISELVRGDKTWRVAARMLEGKHVSALLRERGALYAGIHHGGLLYSADDGRTWERRTNGLTIEHVFTLAAGRDGAIYAGTEPVSFFVSRDDARTWQEFPAIGKVPGHEKWTFPPPPHVAHAKVIAIDPRDARTIYVCVEQGALLKTTDGGKTWSELSEYSKADDLWYRDCHRVVLKPSNPDVLYLTTGSGLYTSSNAGASFTRLLDHTAPVGYPDHFIISSLDERVLFMSGASRDPTTWRKSKHAGGTVLRSRDSGKTWERATRGLPENSPANYEAMVAAHYPGGFALFVGSTDGEIYMSEDGAETWHCIATDLGAVSKGGHFRLLEAAHH